MVETPALELATVAGEAAAAAGAAAGNRLRLSAAQATRVMVPEITAISLFNWRLP